MMKLVIILNDQEEERLEKVSRLMARDPRKQAYIILMNGLELVDELKGEKHEQSSQ